MPIPADEGLYATWIGTAMTALTAAAGFGAYRFPEQKGLFGVAAIVFFLAALYSCWKAVQAWRGATRPAEGPLVSPGLRIEHEDSTYGNVLGVICHIKRYHLRIERAALGVRFVCRHPLHHVIQRLTENIGYRGEPVIRRPRAEWADILFPDDQAARGALLMVELSSREPVVVQEIERFQQEHGTD